jgi:O-antigen/teichoic acid export membrane protein
VLDQGLFSLSNFGLNVALARWLAPGDYGVFTLAYAIFLVLGTVHTALLTEPMIVFGSARYREKLPAYLAVVMRGHWLVTVTASATLLAAAVGVGFWGQGSVALSLLALAVASPFILLLWLMRRRCYVQFAPHLAASGGLVYMGLLLGGAYLMFVAGVLSSPSAFLLMGFTSVASAHWLTSLLSRGSLEQAVEFRQDVVAQHWNYGRWAVGTGVLGAVMLNMYYMVIPASHGFEDAAALKALTNLVMPATQSFWALSVVTLPALVRVRNTLAFATAVRRVTMMYATAALAYWLALGLFHTELVLLLYDGQYISESSLLWLLGAVPVASAGTSILESALRAHERSREVFRAYALAAASTCALGIPLTVVWGMGGAVLGLLVSYWLAVGSMAWSLKTLQSNPDGRI